MTVSWVVAGSCGGELVQAIGNNFDFRLEPSTVVVYRGDPDPATVEMVFQQVGLDRDDRPRCTFFEPAQLPGVTFDGPWSPVGSACGSGATLRLDFAADAPVGIHTRELMIHWDNGEIEVVRRQLTIDIRSEISVAITTPADGSTVDAIDTRIDATASTVFGDLTLVEVIVGSAAPQTIWTGTEASVSISEVLALPPGEVVVTVRATNSLGNTWSDDVTLTVAPVGTGVVVWDGEAGDGLWFTPANWDGDVIPGPGDAVVIDDVTAEVRYAQDVVSSIASLTNRGRLTVGQGGLHIGDASTVEGDLVFDHDLTTGTRPVLRLDGTLTVEGSLTCKRATLEGARIVVRPGASATVDLCLMEDIDVENHGNINLIGETGRLTLSGVTSLRNTADGALTIIGGLIECISSPCPSSISLDNDGTLTVSGFRVSIDPFLTNSGTLDFGTTGLWLGDGAGDGTITSAGASLLVRGDWIMAAGSSLSAGNLQLTGPRGIVMRGAMDVGSVMIAGSTLEFGVGAAVSNLENLEVQTGELALTGDVQVNVGNLLLTAGTIRVETDATLYARKSFGWLEGTLRGPGTTVVSQANITQPEAQFSMMGYGPMKLDGHRLTVLARGNWIGGDVLAGNGAVFRMTASSFSPALMTAYDDNTFDGNALGGAAARFVNEATLKKVGGTGSTTIEACYEGDLGTIVEEAGTITIVQLCPPPL